MNISSWIGGKSEYQLPSKMAIPMYRVSQKKYGAGGGHFNKINKIDTDVRLTLPNLGAFGVSKEEKKWGHRVREDQDEPKVPNFPKFSIFPPIHEVVFILHHH